MTRTAGDHPPSLRPFIALTGIDQAEFEASIVLEDDRGFHALWTSALGLLEAEGRYFEFSAKGIPSGKALLRDPFCQLWIRRRMGTRTWTLGAAPHSEAVVLDREAALGLARSALIIVVAGLLERAPSECTSIVRTRSLTPFADLAGRPLTRADIADLPGLDPAALMPTDRNGSLKGIYAFGCGLYNKTQDAIEVHARRYARALHRKAGVTPEHEPVWRFEGQLGPRELAQATWPLDLTSLRQASLERFLALASRSPRGSERVKRLLEEPPWSHFHAARGPVLNLVLRPPELHPWQERDRLVTDVGFLRHALANLGAQLGATETAPVARLGQILEGLARRGIEFEARYLRKLRQAHSALGTGRHDSARLKKGDERTALSTET